MSRYDWSKIPAEYDWAATSANSFINAFTDAPIRHTDMWRISKGFIKYLGIADYAGDWSESLEHRPKEGNMELDLTKPMRVIGHPESRVVRGGYISHDSVMGDTELVVVENYLGRQRVAAWLRDGTVAFARNEAAVQVENVPPEPVKYTAHVHMTDRGELHLCNGCTSGDHSKDAKITVWRDEEGKTRVEVAE